MSRLKCQCGFVYEDSFKFCPECAEPNPYYLNDTNNDEAVDEPIQEKPPVASARKRFTRISSSSEAEPENSSVNSTHTTSATNNYEDTPPVRANEPVETRPIQRTVQVQQEPEETEHIERKRIRQPLSPAQNTTPVSSPALKTIKRQTKPLAAPSYEVDEDFEDEVDYEDYEDEQEETTVPQRKTSNYNPNYDGYYDDRLPAVLDEATKISHMDVILKIVLAVIGIAALIAYCIFYVDF